MSPVKFARVCAPLAAACLALMAGIALGDAYDEIVKYDWTQSREPLASIEQEIRDATTPAARQAIEAKLLKTLANPQATYGCKQFVCRMLRRAGSAACVPALAGLLADEKLSDMARFALQHNAAPEATDALIAAVPKASGLVRLGLITSLGERRDPKAVPVLARLVPKGDVERTRAILRALGRIACPSTAAALKEIVPPPSLKPVWADSYLLCADQMLADGKAAAADEIYRSMFAAASPKMIRIAALRGIVLSEKEKAAPVLLGLMQDKDLDLSRAATRFIIEMPGPAATKAFAAALPSLPAGEQVALIDALTARGDSAAAPEVIRLMASKEEPVRVAAIRALAVMGDAACVEPLAKAVSAGGAIGQAAVETLNSLKGGGVGDAMSKLLDSADPALRAAILSVMATRADKTMAPAMLRAARDKDATVRQAAVKGLTVVAGSKELPDLVALLVETKDDAERSAIGRAIVVAALRTDDVEARSEPVVAGLAKADAAAKAILVSALGKLGGKAALAAVRTQLTAANADIATEAVRALEGWPDASPAPDLLNLIRTTKSPVHKVLAFRGYLRMANMPEVRPAADTLAMYQQALALASTADEEKAVLSGLANARTIDALKLVEPLLANAGLQAEAELAYVQIADNARDAAPDEARGALRKVIATAKNAGTRQKAQGVINEMDRNKGYVRSWLGCGPYTGGSLFDTAYPPEQKDAKDVKWKAITSGVGPQVIDLEQAIGTGDNRAAYLKTYLWSPEDQDVQLQIGSDDGVKVWIGGKLAHANNATRACRPGEDKAKAHLARGWNPVLIKVTQGGGQWAVCIRVCKPDGSVLDGLRTSTEEP